MIKVNLDILRVCAEKRKSINTLESKQSAGLQNLLAPNLSTGSRSSSVGTDHIYPSSSSNNSSGSALS